MTPRMVELREASNGRLYGIGVDGFAYFWSTWRHEWRPSEYRRNIDQVLRHSRLTTRPDPRVFEVETGL